MSKNGAKKTTCSPRSTPRRRGAVAGSATIKAWISLFLRDILNGRCPKMGLGQPHAFKPDGHTALTDASPSRTRAS